MTERPFPAPSAIRAGLPAETPGLADEALIAASEQPDAPYLQPEDFAYEDFALVDAAPNWRLDIVPRARSRRRAVGLCGGVRGGVRRSGGGGAARAVARSRAVSDRGPRAAVSRGFHVAGGP